MFDLHLSETKEYDLAVIGGGIAGKLECALHKKLFGHWISPPLTLARL